MLKYVSKFALDILPSVVATIIGAYIVNHYIVTRPGASAPVAAAVSTAEPKAEAKEKTSGKTNGAVSEDDVWNQLKQCFDPEIPVNIVDLGLVYDCRLIKKDDGGTRVEVKMTLTAPGCGMGPAIAHDAQSKILTIDGVDEADVQLVWDPPWSPELMSEESRRQLGML